MKKYVFLFYGLLFLPLYAQFKSFKYTDSVDGYWQAEKVRTSIDTRFVFFGNYMHKHICDYTSSWKCYPEVSLYEYKSGVFEPIGAEDIFTDGGKELLKMANEKIQQNYLDGLGRVHDCFTGLGEVNSQTWENIEMEFSEKGITLSYYFDSGAYCDAYNWADTLVTWDRLKPMFKKPLGVTPNFCTPSGPKVNIRSEESVTSGVLFQLDKGQFFEIISTGKKDKVNGKPGSWYKISFEGKQGYIFSFYTLCRDK